MHLKRRLPTYAEERIEDSAQPRRAARVAQRWGANSRPSTLTVWLAWQSNASYADQISRTYRGHLGPVYRVAWSPFAHEHFVTCSADWTVKLWSNKQVR